MRRRWGHHSIPTVLARSALLGVIVLVVVAIVAVVMSRQAGRDEADYDARQLTRLMARSVVGWALTDELEAGDPPAVERMDEVVRDRILGGPVVRVKIWTPEGKIVYSDEPRLIGRVFPLDDEDLEALRGGRVASQHADLDSPENVYDRRLGDLLEVYAPVRSTSGHPMLFEAYLLRSEVSASGWRVSVAFLPIVLIALLALAILQLPLAWLVARRVREGDTEREELLRQAVASSETERRRIAADLHDGVVQDLVGVSYALGGLASQVVPSCPPEVSDGIRTAAGDTRRCIGQLRTLLVDIYPPNLRRSGLEAALSDLLVPLSAQRIDARLEVDDSLDLDADTEALLFRGGREALRNVLSPAEASTVTVCVERADGQVRLIVQDDGKGFDPVSIETEADGHVGLRLMTDLAERAGGRVEIHSEGGGTRLLLEVPVP